MKRYRKRVLMFHLLAGIIFALCAPPINAWAQPADNAEPSVQTSQPDQSDEPQGELRLTQAFMCERVVDSTPLNQAVVFPVSAGQVCCFTSFDPVPQPTLIYHRWYHKDEISTQIRLRLYPPLWSTYSQIQLRETDKGPWRVEITDQNGKLFDVLRFSITD